MACRTELQTCTAGLEDGDDCSTQEAVAGSAAHIWNKGADNLKVAVIFTAGFVDRIKQVFVMERPAAYYLLRGGYVPLVAANV